MRHGLVLAVVLVGLAVASVAAGPAPASSQPDVAEDAVSVRLDPGHVDEISVVVESEDPREAERLVRERAAELDVPVHDVRETEPLVSGRARPDGDVTFEQRHYRVEFTATLGESRGLLRWSLDDQLRTLSGSESSDVEVAVHRGTTVEGDGVERTGGAIVPRYETDGPQGLAYGVSTGRLAILGGWLLASFALPYVVYRRRARRVERSDAPAPERAAQLLDGSLVRLLLLPVAAAVVGLALGARGVTSALTAVALPLTPTGAWWDATLWFLAAAPFPAAAQLGGVAALQRTRSALLDDEPSARAILGAQVRRQSLFGLEVWLAILVFAAVPAWSRTHPVTGSLLLGGLVLARTAVEPYLVRAIEDVRAPDPRIRAEVERLWRDAGRRAPAVYVLETDDATDVNAVLTGAFDAQRTLFVKDDLVAQLSPSERRAAFAHERGHAVNGDALKRAGVAVAIGVLGFSLAWFPPLPDVLVLAAVGLWYLLVRGQYRHRHQFRADRHAAAATSPDAVANVLERLAVLNGADGEPDLERASGHPSIADRLEALGRGASSGEERAEAAGDD